MSRLLLYPFCVFGGLLGLLVTLAPSGPLLLHVGTAVCVLGVLWLTKRARQLGIEVTHNGIVVHNTYVTSRLTWAEIAGFDTRRWMVNREVGIRLKEGRRVRTSLLQGRVVTWKGGKTRDIISVLEADLEATNRHE